MESIESWLISCSRLGDVTFDGVEELREWLSFEAELLDRGPVFDLDDFFLKIGFNVCA